MSKIKPKLHFYEVCSLPLSHILSLTFLINYNNI